MGWQEHYCLEWQFSDGLCWIRQTKPETIWWAPVGPWHEVDWRAIFGRLCVDKQRSFIRVPEELLNVWHEVTGRQDKGPKKTEANGNTYICRSDLAGLAGNKLHKKRNHYNSYVKTYGSPDYRAIDDRMIQDVLSVQDDCQWHECDDSSSLMAENDAVNRVLLHWNNFHSAWRLAFILKEGW